MPRKKSKRKDIKYIRAKERLRQLLLSNPNVTYEQIKKDFPELPVQTIIGMVGYLSSPVSQAIESTRKPGKPTSTPTQKPEAKPTEVGEEKPKKKVGVATTLPKGKLIEIPEGRTPPTTLEEVEEVTELEVAGIPRKIRIGPKTLMFYEFFRAGKIPGQKRPFDGNLGEFFDWVVDRYFTKFVGCDFVLRYEQEID